MAAPLDDRPPGGGPARRGPPRRRPRTPRRRRAIRAGAARRQAVTGPVTGVARIDRRTKRLVQRLQPGDIAVIDHEDLDRVAAETLIDAGPVAVVNAAASISGRYPNLGPAAAVPGRHPAARRRRARASWTAIHEGARSPSTATGCWSGPRWWPPAPGRTVDTVDAAIDIARANMGSELERFAVNTVEYVHQEIELLTGELDAPDLGVHIAGPPGPHRRAGHRLPRGPVAAAASPATCATCGR